MINVYDYVALSGIKGEIDTENRAVMSVGVHSLKQYGMLHILSTIAEEYTYVFCL